MDFSSIALNIIDVAQGVLNAQGVADMGGVCDPSIAAGVANSNFCPASAFTAVGAAFATMGYWIQSDLLDYLTFTKMGVWAPLVYIISAVAGIFGMALGQPPRNYMWFFIGPALYAWLIDTRIDVDGVAWRVAGQSQNQKEVWKLSEVGLVNTNLYDRMINNGFNPQVSADSAPQLPLNVQGSEQARSAVAVALPFLWFDWLISGTVDSLVEWTGLYRMANYTAAGANPGYRTNLQNGASLGGTTNKWYLLSNLKWTYLDDITGAKLGHPMLRASLAQFMGSECGEALSESIDQKLFTAATTSKGLNLPTTIFRRPANSGDLFNYEILKFKLATKRIPTPPVFKRALVKDTSFTTAAGWTFRDAIDWGSTTLRGQGLSGASDYINRTLEEDSIRCDMFLDMLMLLFRWETAQIYNVTFHNQNISGMVDYDIVDSLLYGWDIKKDRGGGTITHQTIGGTEEFEALDGDSLDLLERVEFIHNLIMMHLIRNEMTLVPPKVDVRYSMSQQTQGWMQAYQANIGGKVKFMELYTWAILIPYLQGILMYFLAMMYPIACIMVIMPGQHKWIITWGSFWAWVKLWDLGFAIVISLERSVWAMIGNNAHITKAFDRIVELDQVGDFNQSCAAGPVDPALGGGCGWYLYTIGSFGNLHSVDSSTTGSVTVLGQGHTISMQDANLRYLDMALTVGSNLDLGLANSYYIYIMAALYMAVPAVTGQLVLGARSGAASMVNSAIGGVSQDGGRQAGEGYKGKKVQDDKTSEGAMKQAIVGKAHRQSGMAASAIGASNNAALEGMRGDVQSQLGSGFDRLANAVTLGRQDLENQIKVGSALGRGLAGAATRPPTGAGPTGRTAIEGATDPTGNIGTGGTGGGDGEVAHAADLPAGSTAPRSGNGNTSSAAPSGTPAGGARTQGGGNPLAKLGGRANSLGSKILDMAGSGAAVDILGQAGLAAAARENYRNDNFYKGMQGNAAIQGFGHQQAARANSEHGQRMGQGADFAAEQGAWMEMTEWASAVSGAAVAQGTFAGNYAQGPMPTQQMGMAMNGLLGGNVQAAATYMNPAASGGFGSVYRGEQSGLQEAVGKGATDSKYQERGVETAFMYAMTQGSQQFTQVGTRSGQQVQAAAGLEPLRK